MSLFFCFFEMLKYTLAENLFFVKKEKNYRAYIIGLVIFGIFSFLTKITLEEKHLVVYIVTIVSFYFTLQGERRNKLLNLCILFFIMTSVSGIVQFLYDVFFSQIFQECSIGLLFLLKDIMSILFLGTGILIKKKSNKAFKERIRILTENNLNFVIIFTALIITFTISLLGYSKKMISNERYQIMATAISGIAYISIGFLGGIALYIKILNDKTKKLMKNEVLLKNMQKKYYKALLDKEKETRAYRHDMSNHLICLSGLAEKREIDTLITYLDDMRGEMHRIKGKQYKTGNEILDIMTNFYLPQLSEHIKVSLQTTVDVKLDEMKICTIYANLLQNAVEELNSDPGRDGELSIVFKMSDNTYRIMIENSIFRERESKGFVTQKQDKKNHGIGLTNVESVVEDLGGKIFIINDTKLFKVIVELNTK